MVKRDEVFSLIHTLSLLADIKMPLGFVVANQSESSRFSSEPDLEK